MLNEYHESLGKQETRDDFLFSSLFFECKKPDKILAISEPK